MIDARLAGAGIGIAGVDHQCADWQCAGQMCPGNGNGSGTKPVLGENTCNSRIFCKLDDEHILTAGPFDAGFCRA